MPRTPRTVFTQEQIDILRQKFAEGMINHNEVSLIEAAASETGLTTKIVILRKYWEEYGVGTIISDSAMQQDIDMLEIDEPLPAAEFITIDNEVPIEHLDDDKKAAEPQPTYFFKVGARKCG
ncbi:1694_t:CDS:2 [Paraglomus occultum]|uniref:1694_t:CDS:1 n=1 Tax=Paraglomus occultum TaxID=144539 RepID=A0A9N9D9I4_9GLOM|nr:1694_t:CDS:2 [Paraglomus occultum]